MMNPFKITVLVFAAVILILMAGLWSQYKAIQEQEKTILKLGAQVLQRESEKRIIQAKYDNLKRNVILEQCEWLRVLDTDGEPVLRKPKTPEEKKLVKTCYEMTLQQFQDTPSLYPALPEKHP